MDFDLLMPNCETLLRSSTSHERACRHVQLGQGSHVGMVVSSVTSGNSVAKFKYVDALGKAFLLGRDEMANLFAVPYV